MSNFARFLKQHSKCNQSLALLLIWMLLPVTAIQAQANLTTTQRLELGSARQAEITGGETHSYSLALTQQQFARLTVAQRGLDLTLRLVGPNGQQLADVNNPNGAQEVERASLVAEVPGNYTIEIRPRRKEATRGPYEIRLEELRPATVLDQERVKAERLFSEAEFLLRNQRNADQLQQAALKYEQVLASYKAAIDPATEISTLNQLGEIYIQQSDNEKAVERLEAGLAVLRTADEPLARSRVVVNLGKAHSGLGDTQKAFDYYSEALALSRQLGSRSLEAVSLSNLGAVLNRMGDSRRALEYFNEVRSLYQSAKNTRAEVSAIFNIGVVYSNMGERQKALEIYGQALTIMRDLKYPFGQSYALYNIATVYNTINDPAKALEALNEAITLARTVGDRSQETRVINELGRSYKLMGQPQKALEFYK